MKKGEETTTVSVRLTLARAEALKQRATDLGFKSTNQYLVAALEIIAPLVPAAKSNSGAGESNGQEQPQRTEPDKQETPEESSNVPTAV